MSSNTPNFKTLLATNYKGVTIALLVGHIQDFKGTFIVIPVPTNQIVFAPRFSATTLRSKQTKFTAAQRLFEAAGDADGSGPLSQEAQNGATGGLVERESTVKVTGAYGLSPGIKKVIHAYHPKFTLAADQAAQLEKLRDTYDAVFKAAYEDEWNMEGMPGMKIAVSPLGLEPKDCRAPQPEGTSTTVQAIRSIIDKLVTRKDPKRKPPSQVSIILAREEDDNVRKDIRDREEVLRLKLVEGYVAEFTKQFGISGAPVASGASGPRPVVPDVSIAASGAGPGVATGTASGAASASGSGSAPGGSPPTAPIPNPFGDKPINLDQLALERDYGNAPSDDDSSDPPSDPPGDDPPKDLDGFIKARPLPKSITHFRYKRVLIELCEGDIAHFPSAKPNGPPYARIIVTDAAIELDGNGGMNDSAIHASAGPLLKGALADLKKTDLYSNGRVKVWTTGSFNLGLIGVRRIIHAIAPIYLKQASDASKGSKEIGLHDTYEEVFKEAVKHENDRANMMVALLLLGTGRNNFSPEMGTRAAVNSFLKFVDDGRIGGVNHVVFVVPRRDDPRVRPFRRALREIRGNGSGNGGDDSDDGNEGDEKIAQGET